MCWWVDITLHTLPLRFQNDRVRFSNYLAFNKGNGLKKKVFKTKLKNLLSYISTNLTYMCDIRSRK